MGDDCLPYALDLRVITGVESHHLSLEITSGTQVRQKYSHESKKSKGVLEYQ